jgi:hypothetical protein
VLIRAFKKVRHSRESSEYVPPPRAYTSAHKSAHNTNTPCAETSKHACIHHRFRGEVEAISALVLTIKTAIESGERLYHELCLQVRLAWCARICIFMCAYIYIYTYIYRYIRVQVTHTCMCMCSYTVRVYCIHSAPCTLGTFGVMHMQ